MNGKLFQCTKCGYFNIYQGFGFDSKLTCPKCLYSKDIPEQQKYNTMIYKNNLDIIHRSKNTIK